MKKILSLVTAIAFAASLLSQAPDKMSYQAVVRDANGELVKNKAVGVQMSILKGSSTGSAVYVEPRSTNTNENGLISIEVGSIVTTFNLIDWSAGPYFLKTEIDPAGGTNYTITGTSQIISVPYALHAKTAELVSYNSLLYKPSFTDSLNKYYNDSIATKTVLLKGNQTIAGNKTFTGTISASNLSLIHI